MFSEDHPIKEDYSEYPTSVTGGVGYFLNNDESEFLALYGARELFG